MNLPYPNLLTLARADKLAREVIEEYGADHRYEKRELPGVGVGCLYVWNNEPDCIVGKILSRHGAPNQELVRWENIGAYEMYPPDGRVLSQARRMAGYGLVTPDAATLLAILQSQQDFGVAWGAAYADAEGDHRHNAQYRAFRINRERGAN